MFRQRSHEFQIALAEVRSLEFGFCYSGLAFGICIPVLVMAGQIRAFTIPAFENALFPLALDAALRTGMRGLCFRRNDQFLREL